MLSASAAADALVEGFAAAGISCDALPVADGGEGTLDALCRETEAHQVEDAFGRPRLARSGLLPNGALLIEAAEAIPLDPARLDVMAASSRGLGLWIKSLGVRHLALSVGGTATMDGGAGMLEVLDDVPPGTTVLCDVSTTLYDAPRLFGPQKGATPEQVAELEARFRADDRLAPYAELPGSGAAGGLGAALASLGAELVPGAESVLDLIGFDPAPYDLVVTGEGQVDETTWAGKAPSAVVRRCERADVRCVVFGGRVVSGDAVALSGDPSCAREDLVELGKKLGALVGGA